jgi:hypothetical protein
MEEEDRFSRKGINQGFDPLDGPSRKALEGELSEALKKLEHLVEVLTSISHEQEISGYYGLAEAYSHHAAESEAYAKLIRKLLNLSQGEVGYDPEGIKNPFKTPQLTGTKGTESGGRGIRE